MNTIDFGVFIGRFQPLHIGHEHVIRHALERVNSLIVLVGSAHAARDPRNPFTYDEREAMLRAAFRHEVAEGRLIIAPLEDHLYSDTAWVTQVQRKVRAIVLDHGNNHGFQNHGMSDFRVALAGYGKDASSFYLKLFPEWENLQINSQYGTFSSSDVRARYFQRIPEVPGSILSNGVTEFMHSFMLGETFRSLLEETEFLTAYPAQWGRGPFVTADAVVVQSGHILLVERGRAPGKGLLALPGGFVNPKNASATPPSVSCARKPRSATARARSRPPCWPASSRMRAPVSSMRQTGPCAGGSSPTPSSSACPSGASCSA
jgi:bifunctional NMN adenylyltransferase/nudix hydrolase